MPIIPITQKGEEAGGSQVQTAHVRNTVSLIDHNPSPAAEKKKSCHLLAQVNFRVMNGTLQKTIHIIFIGLGMK
jgi:hypothetical protein